MAWGHCRPAWGETTNHRHHDTRHELHNTRHLRAIQGGGIDHTDREANEDDRVRVSTRGDQPMRETRREYLKELSALSAVAIGITGTATAADCDGVPKWDPDTAYSGGDQVTYDGDLFTAEWWTKGSTPDDSKSVWTLEGACGRGDGNTAPTASFTTDVTTPEPGQGITFDASGSSDEDGTIVSYEWNFDDGTSGNGETVSHTFASSGDYVVTLTVTDDGGASDTASTTVSVSTGNAGPNASFTVSPSSPTTEETVTFDAAESSDSDGTIESYDWEFGDGSTASGQTATHSYTSTGEYTVALTVTDDDGATDSNATTVTVQSIGIDCTDVPAWDPDTAYSGGDQVTYDGELFTAEWWTKGDKPDNSKSVWTLEGACGGDGGGGGGGNEAPTASFTSSPSAPAPGDTVTFDAADSTDTDGTIDSYEWTFGDGSSATGQSVTHTYASAGDYTVSLTVTDDAGGTDTASKTVSVSTSGGGSDIDLFAPYLGTWGDILGDTRNANTDRVVLSFIGDGSADGTVNPGWLTSGGDRPLSDHAEKVQTLQEEGYDVWVAMGGWDGRILARDATSVSEVKSAYETVLDTLGVTHIDIDDENYDEAGRDGTYYEMRNEALAQIQSERPEVKVTYTVAARPDGITNATHCPGKDMISDALEKGVELEYINIMTMDWTDVDTTPARVKSACEGTVDWMSTVYPNMSESERWGKLGFLPNVAESEWDPSDSQEVAEYATQKGVGLVSMWALHKDTSDYEHSAAFYNAVNG